MSDAGAQALAVAALDNAAQALGIPPPLPPGGVFPGGVPPQVGVLGAAQVVGGGAGLVSPGYPPLQPLQPLQGPVAHTVVAGPLGGQQGVGQAAGAPLPPLGAPAQQQGFGAVGQAAFPPLGAGAQQQGYGAAGQAAFYPPFGYGQYAPGGYGFPAGQQWPRYYSPFSCASPGGPSGCPCSRR
jgi:hypothetical protein